MLKFACLPFLLFLFAVAARAQSGGRLSGKIWDAYVEEPVAFANVILTKGDEFITGIESDLDGYYELTHIPPGTYTVEVSYIGQPTIRLTNLIVPASGALHRDFVWGEDGVTLPLSEQKQQPRSEFMFHFED